MYSDAQISALAEARHMPDDVSLISESSRLSHSLDLEDTQAAALLASPVVSQAYQPETQPIHWFTLEECARKDSSVNCQTKIDGIIQVEYKFKLIFNKKNYTYKEVVQLSY